MLRAAQRAAQQCDVLLAVGTTLQVHPAAGLAEVAVAAGARLVIVNRDPTPYDDLASALLRELHRRDPAAPGRAVGRMTRGPLRSRWTVRDAWSRATPSRWSRRAARSTPTGCAAAVALLESWGLTVRAGAHVLDRDPTYPFLAGTDADRAADLQRAWCDPDVAAVFVARGGSGATRLIDRLDWAAMQAAGPKLLVGFSDVTALSEAVATRLGLVSLFGPMPAAVALGELPPDCVRGEHLRRTLFEPDAAREVFGEGADVRRARAGPGVLVGGTLSLLTMTIGTAESRPANGGIAVLEDVAEAAFRLDNRLTQLLRTGWFDGVRGIVLGSWTDCGPDAEATVTRATAGARRADGGRPADRSLRRSADHAAGRRGRAGRRTPAR